MNRKIQLHCYRVIRLNEQTLLTRGKRLFDNNCFTLYFMFILFYHCQLFVPSPAWLYPIYTVQIHFNVYRPSPEKYKPTYSNMQRILLVNMWFDSIGFHERK